MIDKNGRIFGKLNIVDFLALCFVLMVAPAGYFGWKIATKKPVVDFKTTTCYKKEFSCPNCEKTIEIWKTKGHPMPEQFKDVCPYCKCKIELKESLQITVNNFLKKYPKFEKYFK